MPDTNNLVPIAALSPLSCDVASEAKPHRFFFMPCDADLCDVMRSRYEVLCLANDDFDPSLAYPVNTTELTCGTTVSLGKLGRGESITFPDIYEVPALADDGLANPVKILEDAFKNKAPIYAGVLTPHGQWWLYTGKVSALGMPASDGTEQRYSVTLQIIEAQFLRTDDALPTTMAIRPTNGTSFRLDSLNFWSNGVDLLNATGSTLIADSNLGTIGNIAVQDGTIWTSGAAIITDAYAGFDRGCFLEKVDSLTMCWGAVITGAPTEYEVIARAGANQEWQVITTFSVNPIANSCETVDLPDYTDSAVFAVDGAILKEVQSDSLTATTTLQTVAFTEPVYKLVICNLEAAGGESVFIDIGGGEFELPASNCEEPMGSITAPITVQPITSFTIRTAAATADFTYRAYSA